MPYFTATQTAAANIYYEKYGSGRPIVLIHGWPLSHRMWEPQVQMLVEAGFQTVTYDRRGFGDSGKTWDGHDYDTLAADLRDLLEELNLTDATLVGFSMGGGEVARYLGTYGSSRVSRAIFVSSVTPYLQKSKDNPDGVDPSAFEDMRDGVRNDRLAFLAEFGKEFVGWSEDNHPVSEHLLRYTHDIAAFASPRATLKCIDAFAQTDFRDDLRRIDIPTLFIHGDADQVVPMEASAKRAVQLVDGARLEVVRGAPHGMNYTHTETLNHLIADFAS